MTPRIDHIDARVRGLNVLLQQFQQGFDSMYLTKNSNLRNTRNSIPDEEHLEHEIIPTLPTTSKVLCGRVWDKTRKNEHEHGRGTPSSDDQRRPSNVDEPVSAGMQDLKRKLLQTLHFFYHYKKLLRPQSSILETF